jgi:hypothetical protein
MPGPLEGENAEWPATGYANPSLRYISLLREGAKFHGMPDHWIRLLDGVKRAE